MDIHESMHRILQQRHTFADLFYLVFLESYPDVSKHFAGVNLEHQGVLLTMALIVMERHYSGSYPATEMYLMYLGTKHNDRGIPPDLYPHFHDALLAALERFHSTDWNPQLAGQWHDAIDRTIQTMLEGYRQHFHVQPPVELEANDVPRRYCKEQPQSPRQRSIARIESQDNTS